MSSEHPEPVVVGEYPTEFEATIVKNMLTEAGITCQVVGGGLAGFRAEAPVMVRVLVPEGDQERALELLIEHDKQRLERGEGEEG